MSILSKATTGAMIAGAALLVAACGGSAANNTANAPAGNDLPMGNDLPIDNGMPPVDNNSTMAPPADMNAPAMNTTNATNAM